MSIDERLAHTDFPLPAIRQVNNAKHPNAISLGLGELKDFPVDGQIIEAIKNSLLTDGVNYTANAGLPALRTAIAQNQQLVDGYNYSAENVVITIGVQNALYAVIKTLTKLGAKRILIPEVFFGIYRKIPQDFGLQVATYKLTDNFGIDLIALSNLLLPDDMVIINSPANPTGRVFSVQEQQDLAAVLQRKLTHGYLISDEIYSQLVYEGEPAISFSAFFDRTLVLDGISKSAAAAGLRVGWIITRNKKLAQAFTSNNATVISCPPTINQYAAIPVVQGLTKETIEKYNAVLRQNRDVAINLLDKNHIPYIKPTGSFYLFPKISHLLSQPVKQFCLETASQPDGVVVIPGEAFSAPNYIRISLASMQIEEGMERLVRCLKK
ncbi:MAG: pyridoxal phosphate-dependent aminotransferase [Salinivirgaceae bacterium]